MMAPWIICYCFAFFLIFNPYSTSAQLRPQIYYPTANFSTTWTNTNPFDYVSGDTKILPILFRETFGTSFACGFFCNGACTSYLFAVFIILTTKYGDFNNLRPPQVVWSANRHYPVSYGAILNFTATGDLVLRDVDGSTVWSTNTSGKSVVGMNLTGDGNLVLFDVKGFVVWQSFHYPTDCLVLGQRLFQGQQLIPSVSSTNWTAQKGLFSLQVTDEGLVAYVGSNPPQVYYKTRSSLRSYAIKKRKYIMFLNGSLSFFFSSYSFGILPDDYIQIPFASSAQYMRFMPDGHLKVFDWKEGWSGVADLLTDEEYGNCTYPLACGRNAICSNYQQCSCPVSNPHTIDYFRAVNEWLPNLGCSAVTTLTCNAIQDHVFISLHNVTYYDYSVYSTTEHYDYSTTYMENVSMERCKQACLNNCSCKAAFFQYYLNASSGACFLPSEIFTMKTVDPYLNVTAFIKVQRSQKPKKSHPIAVIITSIIGSSLFLLVVVGFITFLNRKLRSDAQMEEEYIDAVPGLPTRFTYEELKTATENFCKKLGEGGFGTVFEGTLEDDSKIAVKCLDGLGHVNKSFIAEVKSIGSIDHVNLVKLRGFCAWKSQRFLVYHYMNNGSLDRWIYYGNGERALGWECRRKIILDIAKGLAYLHEECTQKIIHLDIKPQNILLDKGFNAKVSDFGLSKLLDRDQSHVMTRMRGTPGYMAPEWLSSVIT